MNKYYIQYPNGEIKVWPSFNLAFQEIKLNSGKLVGYKKYRKYQHCNNCRFSDNNYCSAGVNMQRTNYGLSCGFFMVKNDRMPITDNNSIPSNNDLSLE